MKENRALVNVVDVLPPALHTEIEDNAIIVLGIRAAPFGNNAPRPQPQPASGSTDWSTPSFVDHLHIVLDREVEGIPPRARLALIRPTIAPVWGFYQINAFTTVSAAAFNMSARTTQVELNEPPYQQSQGPWLPRDASFQEYRDTTLYIETRRLPLAGAPITASVGGDSLLLDRNYYVWPQYGREQNVVRVGYFPSAFQPGRRWIVSGPTERGVDSAEIVTLAHAEMDKTSGLTLATFTGSLADRYVNATAAVLVNVVRATHGETVGEILGSGNGGQPWQQFTLRQGPLTYVNAATANGGASTLEIQANGLLWSEVPSFIDAGPNDRVFTTAPDANGQTVVQFGDGGTGARLPSGVNNVRAIYRKGSGAVGNVLAGQLTLLGSRPAGVRAVTNPLPAADGVDPEARDDARRNAPMTALTLDRVVSLRDHADFARAYSGHRPRGRRRRRGGCAADRARCRWRDHCAN